jgi:OHCU decarboxylase
MRLDELNGLDPAAAERELRRCCGSARWAARVAAARPFASLDEAGAAADRIWASLEPADWLEAFAAHPRIGERTRSTWEAGEQAGVTGARSSLESLNRAYERRFGYIFIVCAAGKAAGEIVAALERRLRNNAGDELREAAEEQRKITRIRLAKLIS